MGKTTVNGKTYFEDARGALIPENNLKPLDILRNEVVESVVAEAKEMHTLMLAFKRSIKEQIESFIELSASEYEVRLGGDKGNIKLRSIDGKHLVQVAQDETIDFNEQLQTAETLIEECITERAAKADPLLLVMVRAAFTRDSNGSVNIRSILKLQRYDIDDPKWKKAMSAIKESIETTGTKEYIRFYERRDFDKQMSPIPLDLACL